MPPAIHVASLAGTTGADSFTLPLPRVIKERDTLLAIVATDATNAGPDIDQLTPLGWELMADLGGPSSSIYVLRRQVADGERAAVVIPMLDALAWGLSAMVVFRNLDNAAGDLNASAVAVTASTNFAAPSRTNTTYSDLFLGTILVTSAATAVTPPAGAVELVEVQGGGRTLEVFGALHEAVGSTGAMVATTAGAQSGLAGSVALKADHLQGFGLNFAFDPPGAIGLPAEGV